jgi:hypothetical protein
MCAELERFDESLTWYCRALGNGNVGVFTFAPSVLFHPDVKFTAEQKNYLRGVFLLADCFDDSDMQYVAMHMIGQNIFPTDEDKFQKYHQTLRKKYYPRVIFPWYCVILKEDKNLSEADKAELALRIEKSAAHLRELAARGDNEAAGILQNFSDMVKKNKK